MEHSLASQFWENIKIWVLYINLNGISGISTKHHSRSTLYSVGVFSCSSRRVFCGWWMCWDCQISVPPFLCLLFLLLVISIKVIYSFFIVLPGARPTLEIKTQKVLLNKTWGWPGPVEKIRIAGDEITPSPWKRIHVFQLLLNKWSLCSLIPRLQFQAHLALKYLGSLSKAQGFSEQHCSFPGNHHPSSSENVCKTHTTHKALIRISCSG